MARIRFSLSTWAIVLVSAGPAVLFVPRDSRIFVVCAGIAGWLLGYALLRLLASGLLTDPSWRRPGRRRLPRMGRPSRREYVVPAELPPPPGLLIGRDSEVNEIVAYLTGPTGDGPRVVVLYGPVGVGKSSLAIGVAQLLSERYRDGQLLARLDRARTDGGVSDVLRMFVTALGRPNDKGLTSDDKVARRYRELTSGGRVLVILDAADDIDTVRRLLPHGRGCAVLITAREPWLQAPDWRAIPIDRLDDAAALRVLKELVGGDRVGAEPAAANRVVEAAAGNPFALQLAGVGLGARQNWTLRLAVQRMMEVELPPEHRAGLPVFAAALDLSYALLTEEERRGFALLGLLSEETTFARWALGALLRGAHKNSHGTAAPSTDGETDATAERILDRLVRARLVDRRIDEASGVPRFRVPEQIRSYVQARMSSDVDLYTRQRAKSKFLAEERSRVARSAETELRIQVYHRLQAGELSAALTTAHEALALCGERLNRASTEEERADAQGERGLALAALAEVKAEAGWLDEARQHAAEALETDNRNARPRALRCLGVVHRRLHLLDAAEDCLIRARQAATVTADESELVRILRDLALVQALRNENERAAVTIDQAGQRCAGPGEARRQLRATMLWAKSAVLMAAGDDPGAEAAVVEAEAICADKKVGLTLWLPWVHHQRALVALHNGQPGRAREFALRASDGFRDMHHRYGIAHCRLVIGLALLAESNYPAAVAVLEEALQTFSGCGDRWAEADTRLPLATALRHVGRVEEALKVMTQATQDFDDLGDLPRRNHARGLLAVLEKELRETPDEPRVRRAITLSVNRGRA